MKSPAEKWFLKHVQNNIELYRLNSEERGAVHALVTKAFIAGDRHRRRKLACYMPKKADHA